jgi:hypothetical protein
MGLVTKWRNLVELKFYHVSKNFIWPRKVCNAIIFFHSANFFEILYFKSTSYLLQHTQFFKIPAIKQISRNISKPEPPPLIFLYNLPLDIPYTYKISETLTEGNFFINLLLSNDYSWSIKITHAFLLPGKKSTFHINSKYFQSLWRPYFSLLFLTTVGRLWPENINKYLHACMHARDWIQWVQLPQITEER